MGVFPAWSGEFSESGQEKIPFPAQNWFADHFERRIGVFPAWSGGFSESGQEKVSFPAQNWWEAKKGAAEGTFGWGYRETVPPGLIWPLMIFSASGSSM